jgi:hypothetical protein
MSIIPLLLFMDLVHMATMRPMDGIVGPWEITPEEVDKSECE